MKKSFALIVLLFCLAFNYAQVSSITFNKQTFFNPTIESMGFLMTNVDSVIWNQTLLPMGIPSMPVNMKVNALEYKKKVTRFTQYIGYDDRYGVLTVIWKDESGKNSFIKGLRKKLKKKEYNTPGTYKIDYKGLSVIISLEGTKDKEINEMITMEIERK
jgi:hypothetical protein